MSRWFIVTRYPHWPSPYFTQFEAALRGRFPAEFIPYLPVASQVQRGDVVNLHRLKRLYADERGTRTSSQARRFVERLRDLQASGVHLVWTLHNPYPIDGGQVTDLDRWVTETVLGMVDYTIVHTAADARGARELGRRGPIVVAGWAGMPTRAVAPEMTAEQAVIVARMSTTDFPILMLGNWTSYKAIPQVIRAVRERTRHLTLFVLGPCRDQAVRQAVEAETERTPPERLFVREGRVPPEYLYWFFGAARACVCNYNTTGDHWFFRKILHPSSVSAAVVFGVPLVAPALGGVSEIATGHPRSLYDPDGDISDAIEEVERALLSGRWPDTRPTFDTIVENDRIRWAQIVDRYQEVREVLDAAG